MAFCPKKLFQWKLFTNSGRVVSEPPNKPGGIRLVSEQGYESKRNYSREFWGSGTCSNRTSMVSEPENDLRPDEEGFGAGTSA
jgi:hypothetical protein